MTQKTQRQQPLVFFFTTRGGGYTVEATTSLSLSLSLSHTLCTTFYKVILTTTYQSMCPKSYLYIYDFSTYLHFCPSNRSEPMGTGSVMSRFSASSIRRDMFPNKILRSSRKAARNAKSTPGSGTEMSCIRQSTSSGWSTL